MRHNAPTDMHPPHETSASDDFPHKTPNPGVTDWRDLWITIAILVACLTACLGGVYWYLSAQRAAADESLRQANEHLHATAPSRTTPQSDRGTQSSDLPMSGRYPIGPNGKLLRPLDAPTPQPPTKPDNIAFESKEGMEAFSRYVISLIPYAWMSGDTSKIEEVSLPECTFCADQIEKTSNLFASSGWFEDASFTVISQTEPILHPNDASLWHTEIQYVRPPLNMYDGDTLRLIPEEKGILTVQARYLEGSWKVFAMGKDELR